MKNLPQKEVFYSDPSWIQGFNSPFWNEKHNQLRLYTREFVDKEITPYCHEWEETREFPKGLHQKLYSFGLYPGLSGIWPGQYCEMKPPCGINAKEWNYFYEYIILDEFARCGSQGVCSMLSEGIGLGLPPLIAFGKGKFDKQIEEIVKGEKIVSLCITEPYAGSDVAGIRTEAIKTEDGKHYIVNGEKKWITSGTFCDYFTVAVKTGSGMGGISLLLLDKNMLGVKVRHMKCSGLWNSGTAYVTFENVKVPIEKLIGEENQGFKYIMYNFNHERFIIIVQAIRFARVCYQDALNFSKQKEVNGKKLIDNPLIKNKLGHMIRKIESTQHWLDNITYQMVTLPYDKVNLIIGGPIALLKVQTTSVLEYCSRESVQIFQEYGLERGGLGDRVERIYRDVRAIAIFGGSEEIMVDFGVRQAMKSKL